MKIVGAGEEPETARIPKSEELRGWASFQPI
jgi:hypothetical protein